MKIFASLALLLLSNLVFAQHSIPMNMKQDTTTLFTRPGYDEDLLRRGLTKKVNQKDSLWILTLYDKKEVLVEQISFADQKLEVRKGPYFFYENGSLSQEGSYDKGYKHGEWKSYYANKKTAEIINYNWDDFFGAYKSYWDNGLIKKEGFYHKGKRKTGTWKLFYKTGNLAYEEQYDETGKLEVGKYFDQEGKETDAKYLFEQPHYPDGIFAFYRQLERMVRYPKEALKKNIQGVVQLRFIVKKDGTVADVSVLKSPDPELSKESIRVLLKSKRWIPGKEIGEPVDLVFTIPLTFSTNK